MQSQEWLHLWPAVSLGGNEWEFLCFRCPWIKQLCTFFHDSVSIPIFVGFNSGADQWLWYPLSMKYGNVTFCVKNPFLKGADCVLSLPRGWGNSPLALQFTTKFPSSSVLLRNCSLDKILGNIFQLFFIRAICSWSSLGLLWLSPPGAAS